MSGGYGWIQMAIDGKLTLIADGDSLFRKDRRHVADHFFGWQRRRVCAVAVHWCDARRSVWPVVDQLFPGAIAHPEAFVLVGMGGFFAGVARVPLTAMLMVCEMSGSYGLLVPLMLVSIVNMALLSSKWTLYEEQVTSMLDSPAHTGDFVIDVLEQIHVREVFDARRPIDLVREDTPLPRSCASRRTPKHLLSRG